MNTRSTAELVEYLSRWPSANPKVRPTVRCHALISDGSRQCRMPQMRRLSESIDRFLAGVLTTAKVPASLRTDAMCAFLPQPPDYAETLAEAARRA